MVRDDEIARLIQYAKSLNTSVKLIGKASVAAEAAWNIDGSQITIYGVDEKPKISVILDLVHEISHMLEHIYKNDREVDERLEEALDDEDEKKASRRKIYNFEVSSTRYWESVYKQCDLRFDIKKLRVAMAFDTWMYECYLREGKFPSRRLKRQKLKEIKSSIEETK